MRGGGYLLASSTVVAVGPLATGSRRDGPAGSSTVRVVNSAVARTGGVVNGDLAALLVSYSGFPPIGQGIAALIGCDPSALSDPSFPVNGYLIRPEEIFTAWLANPVGFHVFELSRNGESLTVSVPWTRVSRVVLATDTSSTSLSVEIDADRTAMTGELRDGQLTGVVRPAGYVLTVTDEDGRQQLISFATLLRQMVR
jgi:hypothetical protein